ncbi:cyclin-like protein [Fragilaria crotonensis]|nr:cyclin-like protein [Fragilaria crotonensis]
MFPPAAMNARRAFRDVTNAARGAEMNPAVGAVNKRSNAPVPIQLPARPEILVESRNPVEHIRPDQNSYQHIGQVDNIDERDADDPLCATEYVNDMYAHFRLIEGTKSVRPVFMETQPHINERMRSILVDWLVEVHLKFKLVPETLYLTINLIDRYLEKKEVSRPKLQLIGVTSLLIASKYEEIYPPELRDLVYICDRAYTRTEIIEMEENILKTLEYQITIPSAHAFLVRYLKAAHADKRIVQLSCYILDGTLQSYNLLHYLPSQLAAAAVFIARRTVGRNSWSPTLLKYSAYCEEDIVSVARAVLNEKSSTSTELRAVNKKYTSSRYGGVANTVLQSDF